MLQELACAKLPLASGTRARVVSFVADDLAPLRVHAPGRIRAAEYAQHFASLLGRSVEVAALPPVPLRVPREARPLARADGCEELYALRSLLHRLVVEPERFAGEPGVAPLLAWARRRGLLATARAGDGEAVRAVLGSVGALRDVARFVPGALVANAHYFTITPDEQPLPHGVLGDPAGLFAARGTIRTPPVAPRAALLRDGGGWRVARVGPERLRVELPGEAAAPAPIAAYVRIAGGAATTTPTTHGAYELVLVDRYATGYRAGGGATVPPAGLVLRFGDPLPPPTRRALRTGRPVRYRLEGHDDLVAGVQGGPVLLAKGKVVVDDRSFDEEGFVAAPTPAAPVPGVFPADAWRTRAARLGVGVRRDGRLVVAAIEGRSAAPGAVADRHPGATLHDLAEVLAALGARDALNFDGGGSVQLFRGSGPLVRGGDRRGEPLASYERLVPTGVAFS